MPLTTIERIRQQFEANSQQRAASVQLNKRGERSGPLPAGSTIDAAITALQAGNTHYAPVAGIPPLRAAVAQHLATTHHLNVVSENVFIHAGVQEARFLTIQLLGEKHANIGIPAVVEPAVLAAVGVRHLPMRRLAVDPDSCLPTLAAIEAALSDGVGLLYLESPSRLTGKAYDKEQVAAIASLLKEKNGHVIWDQGLSPWVQGPYSSLVTDAFEQVAAIGELWPGQGLDQWMIGYCVAPAGWLPPIQSQKQAMSICTNTPAQHAALHVAALVADKKIDYAKNSHSDLAAAITSNQDIEWNPLASDVSVSVAVRLSSPVKKEILQLPYAAIVDGAPFGAPDIVQFSTSDEAAVAAAIACQAQGAS